MHMRTPSVYSISTAPEPTAHPWTSVRDGTMEGYLSGCGNEGGGGGSWRASVEGSHVGESGGFARAGWEWKWSERQ